MKKRKKQKRPGGKQKSKNRNFKKTRRREVFNPIPETDMCPCGSGRIYGECCEGLGIWGLNEKGETIKRIKLSPETGKFLNEHKKNLEKRLGRPLRGDDKLFPGYNFQEMSKFMISGIIKAKIHPLILYCYLLMDGLLITEKNIDKLEGRDRMLYDGFWREYNDFDEDEKTEILFQLINSNPGIDYSKEDISNYITEAEERDI